MKNRIPKLLLLPALFVLAACGAKPEQATPEAASGQAAAASEAATPAVTNADNAPAGGAPASTEVAAAPAAAHPGEQTYQKTCALCHASTAMGAPMLGSKEDWAPRIAQGTEVLYQHALEGYVGEKGAMPERGGNLQLDDATLKAAVDYMVAKAQ